MSGRLFVFEGIDGAGKSTISAAVAETLQRRERAVILRSFPGREPGTLGELVYRLHHGPGALGLTSVTPTALQLLHVAAHLDAIEREIRPLLESGAIVLLDRYWWSTWAYGVAGDAHEGALAAMIDLERSFWGDGVAEAIFLVERPQAHAPESSRVTEAYAQLAAEDSRATRVVNSGSLDDSVAKVLSIIDDGTLVAR